MLRIPVLAVGANTVRCPVHQERVGAASRVLGRIDRSEQPFAVAHGDAELEFGVVGADVVFFGGVGRGLLAMGGDQGNGKSGQNGERQAACLGHRGQDSPEQPEYRREGDGWHGSWIGDNGNCIWSCPQG